MQNIKLRDFVLPGLIAFGAVTAMGFEYQAENPGLAMTIFAVLFGALLLWLAKD